MIWFDVGLFGIYDGGLSIVFVWIYVALVLSRKIPINPALYADVPLGAKTTVLLQHPNSEIYNIASKVVDKVTVDDVNENVNLYLDSGNLLQSTKKYLLATVPVPISENRIKLYISPFIVYNSKLDIIF